jgi:hypothetical protein
MQMRPLLVLACCASLAAADVASRAALGPPPKLQPRLVAYLRLGGQGDQGFDQAAIRGREIRAAGNKGSLVLAGAFQPGGALRWSVSGMINAQMDCPASLPRSGIHHPIGFSYGFDQVEANLQVPFATGPGWTRWRFPAAEVNKQGLRADSQIRDLIPAPDGGMVAIGMTDGGNSVLGRDPRNIATKLAMPISHGLSRGQSSVLVHLSRSGDPRRAMSVRGGAHGVIWDDWGRTYVYGRGIMQVGQGTAFRYQDGAGLLIADADWKNELFAAHLGTNGKGGTVWRTAAIDCTSGLLVLAGWTDGEFKQSQGPQKQSGGGIDAALAVISLWPANGFSNLQVEQWPERLGSSTAAGPATPAGPTTAATPQ